MAVRIRLPRAPWLQPPADLGTGDITLHLATADGPHVPESDMGLLLSKAPLHVRVLVDGEYTVGVTSVDQLKRSDIVRADGRRVAVVLCMEARSAVYLEEAPPAPATPVAPGVVKRLLRLYPEMPETLDQAAQLSLPFADPLP